MQFINEIPCDINKMTLIIFNNFHELVKYPILKHNEQEIFNLLISPNKYFLCAVNNKKIVGYILCEIMHLDDGRNVLYISYLYVAPSWRNKKIGKQLLQKAISYANGKHLDAVVLIADTDDDKVINFYMTKGFMHDLQLRRYDKYDVFSLQLN